VHFLPPNQRISTVQAHLVQDFGWPSYSIIYGLLALHRNSNKLTKSDTNATLDFPNNNSMTNPRHPLPLAYLRDWWARALECRSSVSNCKKVVLDPNGRRTELDFWFFESATTIHFRIHHWHVVEIYMRTSSFAPCERTSNVCFSWAHRINGHTSKTKRPALLPGPLSGVRVILGFSNVRDPSSSQTTTLHSGKLLRDFLAWIIIVVELSSIDRVILVQGRWSQHHGGR
jgi:hypothetical protein